MPVENNEFGYEPYETEDYLGIMTDMKEETDLWTSLMPSVHQFDEEEITFAKLSPARELAAFIMPAVEGVPSRNRKESLFKYKPAYIKAKDFIRAIDLAPNKIAGMGGLLTKTNLSGPEKMDMRRAQLAADHFDGISRRISWMISQVIQHASITISNGGKYPKSVISYGRDAKHTNMKTDGTYWGQSDVEPVDDIQRMIDIIGEAEYGGAVRKIIMGHQAYAALTKDKDSRFLRNLDRRIIQTQSSTFDMQIAPYKEVSRKGLFNEEIEVYVYRGYYHINGVVNYYMDPRDVLFLADDMQGVRTFGAIYDLEAELMSLPLFPKEYSIPDPSAAVLLTQSAPLPVIRNPNNTAIMRVLA